MAHESLTPEDHSLALRIYKTALPLLQQTLTTLIPPYTTTYPSPSFSHFRELWRWIERLLFRATVLSARTSSPKEEGGIWEWMKMYKECSTHFPPSFRPSHRLTVLSLHLRAYISYFQIHHKPSPPSHKSTTGGKLTEARATINEYRSILDVSPQSQFPKAGERNVRVEEFVDTVVAVWTAAGSKGEDAGWVIDVRAFNFLPNSKVSGF